ncbi:hypothetical protein [Cystovirus CAP4]|uniref:Uncharacterized protein n=1 Tax=Acinetobacter phage CAP7 TaxID=2822590 RepID=A0A9E7BLJ5_9VIRU|nr:hypothetical protein [Cystovirus CAP4]UBF42573.1 hypothetical protein [Cystovirus CAP7]UBF42583.1 hypothetical protein [Cystovirus CAP6]UBF42593.1 hypothetical protein [Cystovirus CAP5]
MKSANPLNYQQAGLEPPVPKDDAISATSMTKLRIFKDHLNETPIIVILVGTTTFKIESLPVHNQRDFIDVAASLKELEMVLIHVDYELLPKLDLFAQLLGGRIYVLEDVPDLERSPSEMMAIGGYRHRVTLQDYMLLLSGADKTIESSEGEDVDTTITEQEDEIE